MAVGRIVRKVARRAGIGKAVTPHTLRHAFITAAQRRDPAARRARGRLTCDPRTAMGMTGPAFPDMTSSAGSQDGEHVLGYPPHVRYLTRAAEDEVESGEAEAEEVP
jgi:integrase